MGSGIFNETTNGHLNVWGQFLQSLLAQRGPISPPTLLRPKAELAGVRNPGRVLSVQAAQRSPRPRHAPATPPGACRPPPAALVPGPLTVLLPDPSAAGAIWVSPSSLLSWGSRKRPGSRGEQQRVAGPSLHAQRDQVDRGSKADLGEGARARWVGCNLSSGLVGQAPTPASHPIRRRQADAWPHHSCPRGPPRATVAESWAPGTTPGMWDPSRAPRSRHPGACQSCLRRLQSTSKAWCKWPAGSSSCTCMPGTSR